MMRSLLSVVVSCPGGNVVVIREYWELLVIGDQIVAGSIALPVHTMELDRKS